MAGERVLVVQNDTADPIGPLGEWLAAEGLALEVRETAPASIDGYAGLIVLGGAASANDHELAPVRALVAEAVAAQLPTLGICLGAQLLAVAAGGRVAANPQGRDFGPSLIAKRAAAATDPLFGPLPITPDVIQSHVDAVTQLPPGAVLLAASPTCDVEAFRVGRLAWGLQFHIETTPAVVRAWAARSADGLTGYDLEAILARSDAVHDEIAATWQPFAAAFAAVVRDPTSVSKPRPIAPRSAAPITDPAAIRAALAAEAQTAHRCAH